MKDIAIWDFWARRYDRLWVQHVVLGPTRRLVHERMSALGLEPARLLDVGCGTGRFAAEIVERRPSCEVVACDTSARMLDHARARCRGGRVTFMEGSLPELRSSGRFDVITCMHALPYLPDMSTAIRAMRDLLSDNGCLFVINVTTNSLYDRVLLSALKLLVSRADYAPVSRIRRHMADTGLSELQVSRLAAPGWVPSVHLVEGRRVT